MSETSCSGKVESYLKKKKHPISKKIPAEFIDEMKILFKAEYADILNALAELNDRL